MHGHVRPGLVALLAIVLALAACEVERDDPNDAATGDEINVPLQIVEGPEGQVLAFVPVFIEDEGPFGFALDTGASRSLIDGAVVEQLNLEIIGPAGPAVGVTGMAEADLVQVDQWRLGDAVDLPSMEVTTLDLPSPDDGNGLQGLLGADVLSLYGSILIDFDEELLVLRPHAAQ
jgi:hypothetical protein